MEWVLGTRGLWVEGVWWEEQSCFSIFGTARIAGLPPVAFGDPDNTGTPAVVRATQLGCMLRENGVYFEELPKTRNLGHPDEIGYLRTENWYLKSLFGMRNGVKDYPILRIK